MTSKKQYKTAICCFLLLFVNIGITATSALFYSEWSGMLSISMSDISMIPVISTFGGFLGGFVVSRLTSKLGIRTVLFISCLCGALDHLFYCFANNLFMLYAAAAMTGVTLGLGGQAAVSIALNSYYDKGGTKLSGIVFSAVPIGSAIFTYIGGVLVEAVGVRKTQGIFAVIHFLAMLLVLILFNENKRSLPEAKRAEKGRSGPDAKMILAFSGMVFIGAFILTFKSFSISYWRDIGYSPIQSVRYMTLILILAYFTTSCVGYFQARFGVRAMLFTVISTHILGVAALLLDGRSAGADTMLLVLTILCIGLSYPCNGAIPGLVAAPLFGQAGRDRACGLLMSGYFLGGMIGPKLIGILHDLTGDYETGNVCMIIAAALALILFNIALSVNKKDAL